MTNDARNGLPAIASRDIEPVTKQDELAVRYEAAVLGAVVNEWS
ncbi:hypothetical protein [Streptomyces sp. NBC_01334]|nr:hypothetical protein OG736_42605 [Streptomyces sp. NBC_01334]